MVEAEAPYDIEYRDSTVEKALKLTPADLRFIDDIITKVESAEDTGWVGSDSWIRYSDYLCIISFFKFHLINFVRYGFYSGPSSKSI